MVLPRRCTWSECVACRSQGVYLCLKMFAPTIVCVCHSACSMHDVTYANVCKLCGPSAGHSCMGGYAVRFIWCGLGGYVCMQGYTSTDKMSKCKMYMLCAHTRAVLPLCCLARGACSTLDAMGCAERPACGARSGSRQCALCTS